MINNACRRWILAGFFTTIWVTPVFSAETLVECDFRAQEKAYKHPGPALLTDVPSAMTPISLNAVQIGDKKIARKILIQSIHARRTATNTVEVIVRMVNYTDYEQHVQLRSSFMDGAQIPLESTSAWTRVFIPARSTGVYSEKSISTSDVTYYLAEMREGD